MKTEIEVKFLNINLEVMREKLESIGAVCDQPMQTMRRVIFDTPEMRGNHAFVRVRDEGHRITMTYKQFDEMSLTGAKEIELHVNSYEDALLFVEAAGAKIKSSQEARRELWHVDDAEIVLDEWPWLNPYMEIEAPSEQSVRKAAAALGLRWDDAAFGDINIAFRQQYPHMKEDDAIYNLHDIRFDLPLPKMLEA